MNKSALSRGFIPLVISAVLMTACGAGSSSSAASAQASSAATASTATSPGDDGPTGTLIVAQKAISPRPDHAALTTVIQYNDLYALYDPLNRPDTEGKTEYLLAEGPWEMETPTSWLVHLRHGVKFHDGTEMTADDVVFSLKRYADESLGSIFTAVYSYVDEVEKVDDYTVRITTKDVRVGLEREYGRNPILPAKYFQEVGAEEFFKAPIGTGPFKFVEQVPGQSYTFEANEDYFLGAPSIKTLTIRLIEDPATRVSELLSGGIGLAIEVGPSDVDRIESSGVARVESFDTIIRILLMFALDQTPELQDVRVREAIFSAIDVDAINQAVYGGRAGTQNDWLDYHSFGYNPDAVPFKYDPDHSRELLADAGYADGLDLVVQAARGDALLSDDVMLAIADQLGQVGINVDMQFYEFGDFSAMKQAGEARGLYEASSRNTSADPDQVLRNFDPKREDRYYLDSELERLVDEQAGEFDPDLRFEMVKAVSDYLYDNFLSYNLLTTPGLDGVANCVIGYSPGPYQVYDFTKFAVDGDC